MAKYDKKFKLQVVQYCLKGLLGFTLITRKYRISDALIAKKSGVYRSYKEFG